MHASERRELSVSTSPVEDDMIAVAIADTGCGIPPEIASQLFVTTKQ
jgi:C4-dicarboxylate-specific signal transduction histidine kinase